MLIGELKRRGVIRVGVAYLAASWLLIQVADTVFPAFGLPPALLTALIMVLAVGLIPAVVLSWKFEWTAAGLRADSGAPDDTGSSRGNARYLDRAITVLLVVGISYFALDKFVFDPARDAARIDQARQEGRSDAILESFSSKSIAVLPFVNMSSDPEQEYFSDGIAEEILNLLASIEDLRVISRSSAFSFKGKDINISQLARELNVAHVLEGSVRRAGNRLRITAQLIDARSDTHLWSETYDRDLDDIFAIQDEIAASIADQLKITMLGDAPMAKRADPQAYALYMHARYLINSGPDEAAVTAGPLIDQALAIDPDYVEALVQKLRIIIRTDDNWPTSAKFHDTVARIVAADPDNASAHGTQSWVAAYVHRDYPAAARHLELAMSRRSTDVEHWRGLAHVFAPLGLNDEAVAVYEYLVDRDPTCIQCRYLLAAAYRRARMFPEAEATMQSTVDLLPTSSAYRLALARTQLLNGKAQAVLDWLESQDRKSSIQIAALEIMALHTLGRETEAQTALEALIRRDDDTFPEQLAEVLAWTGDADRAFAFLDKPRRTPEFSIRNNPFFDNLHEDPRWQAMLEMEGASPEQLAALDIKVTLPPGVIVKNQPGN